MIGFNKSVEKDKGKEKVDEPMLKTIPQPPQSFPQRIRKKQKKGKYQNFLSMVK